MNSFSYASRILKETSSLMRSGLVQHVYIAALHDEGMREQEKIDEGREIRRIRLTSKKWSRSLAVQLIKYFEFSGKVIQYARTKKITMINIHSLALLPLGVLLKHLLRAKLVYDAHELETEVYGLSGFRQFVARQIERTLIGRADLVIVVGNGIEQWYRDKYGLAKIVTVLNSPRYQEPRNTRRLHHELDIPERKKIVIYQGGLVGGRGIERLLRVFAERDDGVHVLVLMGYGDRETLIREYADAHDNIYFKNAVEPAVVLEYTASATVGVAYIDNPSMNDQLCLPNKLFEYIMAGLPVIVNNAPEMCRLVKENQVGVVLDDLTVQSLACALRDLEGTNPITLSENLRQTARYFSWEHQEQVMLNAYRKFIQV